jgi:hypothetical protein
MKEARDRQRRRRQKVAVSMVLLAGIGGIGYGIDRGVSDGHPTPACSSDCSGAAAAANGTAPIIFSVLSEPSGLRLSSGPVTVVPGKQTKGLNVVPAPRGLAFKVRLHNRSSSSQTNVKVTLTVYRAFTQAGPNFGRPSYRRAAVETKHVDTIGPNRTETITFSGHLIVPFADATKVKVAVAAVSSAKLTVRRAINYPVIFTLP